MCVCRLFLVDLHCNYYRNVNIFFYLFFSSWYLLSSAFIKKDNISKIALIKIDYNIIGLKSKNPVIFDNWGSISL